jgi:hypothetical protein
MKKAYPQGVEILFLRPSYPFPRIIHLSYPRISVLPGQTLINVNRALFLYTDQITSFQLTQD